MNSAYCKEGGELEGVHCGLCDVPMVAKGKSEAGKRFKACFGTPMHCCIGRNQKDTEPCLWTICDPCWMKQVAKNSPMKTGTPRKPQTRTRRSSTKESGTKLTFEGVTHVEAVQGGCQLELTVWGPCCQLQNPLICLFVSMHQSTACRISAALSP